MRHVAGGLFTTGRASSVQNEWLMCTPDDSMSVLPAGVANARTLQSGSPALYALVSDTTSTGHLWVPSTMPDGNYGVTSSSSSSSGSTTTTSSTSSTGSTSSGSTSSSSTTTGSSSSTSSSTGSSTTGSAASDDAPCFGRDTTACRATDAAASPLAAFEACYGRGDTAVATRVPMTELVAGDVVLSVDADLKRVLSRVIVNQHVHSPAVSPMVRLEYEGGSLSLTPDHVLMADGAYVPACRLSPGAHWAVSTGSTRR